VVDRERKQVLPAGGGARDEATGSSPRWPAIWCLVFNRNAFTFCRLAKLGWFELLKWHACTLEGFI
jgi:hypothetical protein